MMKTLTISAAVIGALSIIGAANAQMNNDKASAACEAAGGYLTPDDNIGVMECRLRDVSVDEAINKCKQVYKISGAENASLGQTKTFLAISGEDERQDAQESDLVCSIFDRRF
ncbi:MAG: hypothetical protein LBB23_04675 [Rickettsiales bacterium]|jgi:hypothetical protein|nr:hypothetical protein [Rickettsiales bacterium]